MSNLYYADYESPVGVIEITSTDEEIIAILFLEDKKVFHQINAETPKVLVECLKQLDEYFKGQRQEFSIPFRLEGTDFQKKVWAALTSIPFAETGSYKGIAVSIGNEKAVRAVGMTNGKNKISIIVPCHRIIGSNGKLTGYAGGLWRKEWLLEHEKKIKNMQKTTE